MINLTGGPVTGRKEKTMELIASPPTNIGQDIAHLRAEIGATQNQLASKSGIDQSRISRIEKGETGTPSELGKILDALAALGSRGAADYGSYVTKDWQYIERPDFSNPQRNILEVAEESLRQMAEFLDEEERPWPLKRQLERQRTSIEAVRSVFVEERPPDRLHRRGGCRKVDRH